MATWFRRRSSKRVDQDGTGLPTNLRQAVAPAAAGAACAGLAVLVALDGPLPWRVVRVALVIAAGTVIARRRGPRGLRTGAELLLGAVAFVAGAGVGVPHALAGAPIPAGAGLLALAAGTTLMLTAATGAWATSRRRGRVGVVLTGFVVAQWILFPVSVAVLATHPAPTSPSERTPADVGLPYRDVTITTADGVELAAWYVPSTNGAAVVLLHGAGSTRSSVLGHAEVLAERGFGVLLVDARGHGGSGGRAMDFGWYGDADVAAAVGALRASSDVTAGIGAVGISMGGEVAIGAAATVPDLAAVVAEGATGRRGSDWLPLRPTAIARSTSAIFYAVQDAAAALLSGAAPPMDLQTAVVAAAPRPMLLVTGAEVPREATAAIRLQRAAPARIDVWHVPGAGHTDGLSVAPEDWAARVGAFLERALLD